MGFIESTHYKPLQLDIYSNRAYCFFCFKMKKDEEKMKKDEKNY
jgi:hypothetical protein